MGNTIQSNLEDTVVDGGPLMFHEIHASNVELSHAGRKAKRLDGHHGLVFSQRPILPGERVCLKVTGLSHGHNNKGIGLSYGYTAVDPSSNNAMLDSGRQDIVATEHGYWLKAVSESVVKRGSVLLFWLSIGGEVYYGRNDEERGVLFSGVRTDLPLWVVVDLCGSATSLKFVDIGHFSKTAASDVTKAAWAKFESRRTSRLSRSTEELPSSAAEASSSDIHRRRTSLQQKLFSSARHASRSDRQSSATREAQEETSVGAGRRSKRRPQSQYQSVVVNMTGEQSASSDTSHDASRTAAESQSTGSTQVSHQQPGVDLQSHATVSTVSSVDSSSSQPAAHRLAEASHSVTQEPRDAPHNSRAVTRRYRTPAVTKQMPFSSTMGRNVHVSDDCRTARRRPGDFCNAYVFTEQPLLPGEELVLRITGTNMDYAGGLTVGLTACNPATLNVIDLPDDADKLLDRPEYWVVHKNICSRPKLNDELAFLRTVSGEMKFCKNGRRAGTLMYVDCSLPLWALFDIYGTTNELESIGVVSVPATVSDEERNAAYLSRFSQRADDRQATPASASNAAATTLHGSHVSASRSTNSTTHGPQPVTTVSQSASNSSPSSPVVTSPSTNVGNLDVSALLFDDQLLPELPPPLIPVPDRYQPLVDIETSDSTDHHPQAFAHKSQAALQPKSPKTGECSVCMESEPNAALYPCGHMCMCYECAVSVQKLRGALCPICRQPIIEILRIYHT